jgi:hypothetical protein
MLFGEIFAVCCENHTEHTDKLCGHNAEFYYVNGVVRRANTGLYKGLTNQSL